MYSISLTVKIKRGNVLSFFFFSLFVPVPNPSIQRWQLKLNMAEAGHFVQELERFDPCGGMVLLYHYPKALSIAWLPPHPHSRRIRWPSNLWNCVCDQTFRLHEGHIEWNRGLISAVWWDETIKYCRFNANNPHTQTDFFSLLSRFLKIWSLLYSHTRPTYFPPSVIHQ